MEENNKKININIMRPIDEAVLNGLDKIKELPQYQKVQDQYNLLEDHEQTIVNTALMFLTILIPLLLTLVFYFFYSSTNTKLNSLEEVIQNASAIISKTQQINEKKRTVLGQSINTEGQLKNIINSSLRITGIEPTKIIINNFDLYDNAGINEVSATLQFKDLSNINVYSLFKSLIIDKKFKAKSINIEKDLKSELLNGSLNLIVFSKGLTENE